MDKKRLVLMIGSIAFAFVASAAVAEEAMLPATLLTQDRQLVRCSRGQLKAFGVFDVGHAALYLERCQHLNDIFDTSPKRLRFVYERSIPATAFREAAEKYLKINLGTQFDAWREAIERFNRGYRDIDDGDYYDLIYNPQTGLALLLNGAEAAVLRDPRIGLAYLTIWFGQEPFSEGLKEALLTPETS